MPSTAWATSASGDVVDQAVVDVGDAGVVRHVQTGRGVALRVEVDHQHPVAVQRERHGEVDRRGGLADAALLVRHAHDPRIVAGRGMVISPLGLRICTARIASMASGGSSSSSASVSRETCGSFAVSPGAGGAGEGEAAAARAVAVTGCGRGDGAGAGAGIRSASCGSTGPLDSAGTPCSGPEKGAPTDVPSPPGAGGTEVGAST